MQIQQIHDQETWNAFHSNAGPHTFLHTWEWGLVQEAQGRRIHRFAVYDGETLRALVFFVIHSARRGRFLVCPHGPVFHPSLSEKEQTEVLSLILEKATEVGKENGCHYLRVAPLVPDAPAYQSVFTAHGYRPSPLHLHPELNWLLDIRPSEEELLAQMRKGHRYDIRKAQREGVSIRESTDLPDLKTLWKRHGETAEREKFTPFSFEMLKTELEVFAPDNACILLAEHEGEILSTAFIVFTDHGGFYHHGASRPPKKGVPAAHLVQWEAIRLSRRRGCSLYSFWGIAPEDAPKNHPWHGLTFFKKGFGGFGETYLHAQDKPLSLPRYYLVAGLEHLRRIRRGL